MRRDRPRFYFSFRSPYAWIASRLLEERLGPATDDVEYIPYWEPDASTLALLKRGGGDILYAPMSRQKHLYILQDIHRLATALGYPHAWPIDANPWWELPHLGYLVARRLGKGPEFFRAIYRARWEEGANICVPETIRTVATQIGLSGEDVVHAPDEPDIRQEGAVALSRAHREGVFGVPFFVTGSQKFWGVDRLMPFIALLTGAGSFDRRNLVVPPEAIASISFDTDCPGGCG
jgi:2-hydroxychromene-2-carboxylate isomerase